MTDNELLLAMSDMLDKKLKPVNDRLKKIELAQENDILPRLQNIEACYTSTFKRFPDFSSCFAPIPARLLFEVGWGQ